MATNIDRLFRENLDQVEMTPSAEGWKQVKSQLTTKQPVWIMPMRIAAAVTVLIIASLLLFNDEQSGSQGMISEADHPVLNTVPEFNISEELIAKAETSATQSKNKVVNSSGSVKPAPGEEKVEIQEPMNTYTIARISTNKLDVISLDLKPGLVEKDPALDQPSIRITYIAANTPDESDNNGKLSKMLTLAREVTSSELLADIRDAKYHLFNKN